MQPDLQNANDRPFKILILGDAQVGKTSIVSRMKGEDLPETYTPTIAIDFRLIMVPIESTKIKLQIWDVAGQEKFRPIFSTYSRDTKGAIFVFDVTNRESLKNIGNWDAGFNEEVIKVLIGNKTDIPNREVSFEEAKKYAESKGMHYVETSAKTNNKDDIFCCINNMIDTLQLRKGEEPEGIIRLKKGEIKQSTECFSEL